MNRYRLAPIPLLALLLVACRQLKDLQEAVDGVKRPTARVVGVTLSDMSLSDVTLGLDLEVDNPYSFPLPVAKLEYSLASGGLPLLSGRSEKQGLIPAMQTGRLPLAVTLSFRDILDTMEGITPGTTLPYSARLGIFLDAKTLGTLHVPVRHEGELPIPAVPEVKLEGILWESATLSEVRAVLSLEVVNTNQFPVDLTQISYALNIAGTDVGGASLEKAASFDVGGSRTLRVPLSFSPRKLGLSALKLITDSDAGYEIEGVLKGSTPYGDIDFPFEKKGKMRSRR